jgi:hypothetical protein
VGARSSKALFPTLSDKVKPGRGHNERCVLAKFGTTKTVFGCFAMGVMGLL